MSDLHEFLDALALYRTARHALLAKVGVPLSNRDPLAEFAEAFVAALVGGSLATSRVQAGWDVETPTGTRYQVKYLANTIDSGVNEHCVRSASGVHWYALVLIEDFTVVGVMAFPPDLTSSVLHWGRGTRGRTWSSSSLVPIGLPFARTRDAFAPSGYRSGSRLVLLTVEALCQRTALRPSRWPQAGDVAASRLLVDFSYGPGLARLVSRCSTGRSLFAAAQQ